MDNTTSQTQDNNMINLKLSEKIINEISKSLKNGQNKEIITPLIANGKEFLISVNFCGYPNYKDIEICLHDLNKKNEHNPTKLIYINHYLTYLPKIESIYNILLSLFNLIQLNYDNVIKANKNDYLISIKGSLKQLPLIFSRNLKKLSWRIFLKHPTTIKL